MPSMVKVPAEFKAGASLKWQIEIQNTLNTSAALVPSVPVWDLDLFHVARTPETITYLRVRALPLILRDTNLTHPETKPECLHHLLLQRRVGTDERL